MVQTFWKSMAFMGLCFVLLACGMEIFRWATAHL